MASYLYQRVLFFVQIGDFYEKGTSYFHKLRSEERYKDNKTFCLCVLSFCKFVYYLKVFISFADSTAIDKSYFK